MSFLDEFRAAMLRSAFKVVTRNDVAKKAYHCDVDQQWVMEGAGLHPVSSKAKRIVPITVAGTGEILASSYYASRLESDERKIEPRIGRDLINWVRAGETLWLGTDGMTVFAFKSSQSLAKTTDQEQIDDAIERLGASLDLDTVIARARASFGQPGQRTVTSTAYERNGWVRELARRRSGCRCEMPGCDYVGFVKADGTRFIEVHHIRSLARAGHDIIENVAAVCPNCHARAHYAVNKAELERQLLKVVHAANVAQGLLASPSV